MREFQPGQLVWWMKTLGGGGGSGGRTNEKRPCRAEFNRYSRSRTKAFITTVDDHIARATWVDVTNLHPRFRTSLERAVYEAKYGPTVQPFDNTDFELLNYE